MTAQQTGDDAMRHHTKTLLLTVRPDGNYWFEIPDGELDEWLQDGSVEEGDTVVYVYVLYHVKQKKREYYLEKEEIM